MGRGFHESKSADPFGKCSFISQAEAGRTGGAFKDWVSFQDHRNCLPCQCSLHSQLEPSSVCSAPVTDTEVTHNWKMPDKRKKPNKKVNSAG